MVFFYPGKVLFSGFLQFKGIFFRGQNNSKYRDWGPLKRSVQIDTQDDWVDAERMAHVVVYYEQKSKVFFVCLFVCVDPKDVEQQHGESLSYLGQRHKDGTKWISGNSATTKD